MDKLLPCPFCNCLHAPSVHTDERGFFVWCDTNYGGCGSRGAVASTSEGAIIVWNYRTPATTAGSGVVTVLRHKGPLPSPAPDIVPPLANAPTDRALLALARLGARLCRDQLSPTGGFCHAPYAVLDRMGVEEGVLIVGYPDATGPVMKDGIRKAIADILGPVGGYIMGGNEEL